jgi:hypothetical protein
MRPDRNIRLSDFRRQLRRAFLSYDGDPRHIPVWLAYRRPDYGWNKLRSRVAEVEGLSGASKAVSEMVGSVEEHLQDELEDQLRV